LKAPTTFFAVSFNTAGHSTSRTNDSR
jgi:hypothetical protein